MSKQPSHSGEPPVEAAPDSGEKPFDPSHFGRHEFPAGLREELIKAEKPRIDPKFLQDTVPPNHKPVLTEPERPATTPRGGFAAPKTQGTVDRNAPTLIAAPASKPVESVSDRDATTLIKVPTAKPRQTAPTAVADSPSAPPVDTSRTDTTLVLPGLRKKSDKRLLVIGAIVALLALLIIGLLIRPSGESAQAPATPSPKPAALADTAAAIKPSTATPVTPAAAAKSVDPAQPSLSPPEVTPRPNAADSSAAKKKSAPPSKPQPSPTAGEPKPSAPSTPKPVPAPTGKQPWIDGL